MNKTLIIMAGGMGSRYGGLKQIDGFGPNGETIMAYTIYDAIKAGCDRIVIVIKPEYESAIKKALGEELLSKQSIIFVYQEYGSKLPKGFDFSHRLKPWGTGHAVLVCKDVVDGPFVVVNADDWYGFEGMKLLFDELEKLQGNDFAMIGYALKNTLPNQGTVNRGVCVIDNGKLNSITENHDIGYKNGVLCNDLLEEIDCDSVVSINFWGFTNNYFTQLEVEFTKFLQQFGTDSKKEFYIPTVCNKIISDGIGECFVKTSSERRSGVTNKEDKPLLQAFLKEKINEGYYPNELRK